MFALVAVKVQIYVLFASNRNKITSGCFRVPYSLQFILHRKIQTLSRF